MLLSEEHGGVPYRGPDDPITVLEEERKKNVSLGAVMEGEETVLVKNQGRFQSIVISADAVQQGSACASRKGSSTRSSVRGRRGGSTGPTLLTNASVMGSSSLDHEAGLNCNWRAFPPCYPGAPFNAADAEEEMGASSFSLTRSSSREGAMTRRSVRGSVRSYGSLPLSPAGSRAGGYGSDPKEVFATSSLSDPQEGFAIELHHSVTQSLSQSDTEEDAAGVQDAPPSYGAHDMHADPLENTASTALRWLESTTQDAERADRAQGDGV